MSMIHDITAAAPRYKRRIRKGRGEGSGRGKTAGRGTKGSGAHGGDTHWIPGREGGQTPLFRRFPKRGFSNDNFERRYHVVNLSDLNRFDDGATVDQNTLIEAGLVPDDRQPVKVLGDGELTKKLTVVAGWYSKSAHQKITAAGGAVQNAKGETFEFPKPKKKFVPRDKADKAEKAERAEQGGGKKGKGAGGSGEAGEATGGGESPAPAAEAAAGAAPAEG
jgi:large subunit ribosomal protein L15